MEDHHPSTHGDFVIPRATIEPARAIYVAQFQRVITAMGDPHIEPALRQSDGSLATDGELELPYRVDLMTEDGGESIMVDSPTRSPVAPWEAHIDSVDVSIAPFVWDCATVSVLGLPERESREPLRQWFLRWFDTEDEGPLNEEGLYGVVHYMADPKAIAGGMSITIDFGSASLESFDSLIDALVSMRPRRIEIA
jgi:hypothetical protein